MSTDRSWLQRIGLGSASEWGQRVYLNVGGTAYTTTRQTFRRCEGSPLLGPVLRGQAARDEEGNLFLDLDGPLFRHILNFLRTGTLALPADFSEWALLEQEVACCQLPELTAALEGTYAFQRHQFRRALPPAVCVCWPKTVVVLEGETDLARRLQGGAGTARAPGTATSTAEPKSHMAHLTEQMQRSVASVSLAPPLPALRVSEAGSTVIYNEETVLYNLEQLVSVLLCVYEYKIEHWAEREGRVFLSLAS